MTKQYKSICERITQRIIDFLDEGIIPWQKPWKGGSANAPRSVSTKKVYRGTNLALLSCAGYNSPWWITFGQARKIGGAVRKGERSFPVHYWKFPVEGDCKSCNGNNPSCPKCEGSGRYTPLFARLFSFNIFNASQCDGLPEEYYGEIETDDDLNDFTPIEKAEKIVSGYENPPEVFHDQSNRNFYYPLADEVHLTKPEQFISDEEYYSTTFHELVHSTGHSKRLDRGNDTRDRLAEDSKHEYSKEELVAEIGSTYLCGIAGIDKEAVIKNSSGYIQSWKEKLEDNKDWIVWAGTRASKAADHILGTEYGKETKKKGEKKVGEIILKSQGLITTYECSCGCEVEPSEVGYRGDCGSYLSA